jgi:antirestriction protein ArdC
MAKKTNSEIRKMVQDTILKALEKGTNPWRRQWSTAGNPMPHNCTSGHQYSGVNVPYLWAVEMLEEYPTSQWLTYRQARKAGGHVRKGEKSNAFVIFAKPLKVKDRDDPEKLTTIFMLRGTPVFNIAQCDEVKLPKTETLAETLEPNLLTAQVQDFLQTVGAAIKYNGASAHYNPLKDVIGLPQVEQFDSTEAFAATALHELVHWTGHKSRCNRPGITECTTRKSDQYGKEELIAEMGSAMLCCRFGISNQTPFHANYIDGWIKIIKADERAVFVAARSAEAALDYLDEAAALKKAA